MQGHIYTTAPWYGGLDLLHQIQPEHFIKDKFWGLSPDLIEKYLKLHSIFNCYILTYYTVWYCLPFQ